MHQAILLCVSLVSGDVHDYARPLDARRLDQAAFDSEGYGDKKVLKRGEDGLGVTVAPGGPETGWKTPQALKIGGDFTVAAKFTVRKLPKPAQEDGVAIGLAIATQNTDQPDAVLVRVIEPNGQDVYRSVEKAGSQAQAMQVDPDTGMVMPQRPGAMAPKVPRKIFPARGEGVVMEFRREGQILQYFVLDAESNTPRYLGQTQIGAADISGVKMFALNRNGAEALDVVLRELTVRAERITGLGTEIRTVFGEVIHGNPNAIEGGKLVVASNPTAERPNTGRTEPGPEMPTTPAEIFAPVADVKSPAEGLAAASAKDRKTPAGPVDAKVKVGAGAGPGAEVKNAAAPGPASPAKAARKATIPLEELESIAFERALNLSGRVVGQPNLDFTMAREKDEKKEGNAAASNDVVAPPPGTISPAKIPKVEPKPNGVRDVHLTLSNLRNSPVTQLVVGVQTDKGQTSWRLDTSNSNDWPLVLRRAGTESWADLFLEPPAGDIKGKDFTVNITFQDGQNGNATIKSEVSVDPKLVFDPKAPAPSFDARVFLAGGEQLFGLFEGLGEDALRLRASWGDALAVPLTHVHGVYMGLPDHKETPESFRGRLLARGTEDLLLARSKDGEVVAISGIAEGTTGDRLRFRFQGKVRSVSLKQVEGLVLAARPEPARPDGLQATFSLAGGLVVTGRWKSLDDKTWKVETGWGQILSLPPAEVRGVRFRGGQMTYLCDLEPTRVEEVPYFGRRSTWRKDSSLASGPLKMDGRTYEHGLAVHSRAALTYDLGGRYAVFEAVVGFDEAAGKAGRVDCRVLADDREIYANADLRADSAPVRLSLPVAGAGRLRLVVDFGTGQDTGDRVIWADARVLRQTRPATTAVTADEGRGQTDSTRPNTGGGE